LEISFDDFEENDGSWLNGNVSSLGSDNDVNSFLGRYGRGTGSPSKTFTVPTDADYITIDFFFLEIDDWEDSDNVKVVVNGDTLDMGVFNQEDTGDNDYYENVLRQEYN
jgi:hypothetical protein